MKSFVWLVLGVVAGFVAAHVASRTSAGRALFADLDQRTREFTGGIVDGYRTREAELRDDTDPTDEDADDTDRDLPQSDDTDADGSDSDGADATTADDTDGPIETATGTGAAAFSEIAEPTGTTGSH